MLHRMFIKIPVATSAFTKQKKIGICVQTGPGGHKGQYAGTNPID